MKYSFPIVAAFLLAQCATPEKAKNKKASEEWLARLPDRAAFQQTLQGRQVDLFFLKNSGVQAAITNYGGRIVGLWVPDRKANMVNVVLGYDSLAAYTRPGESLFGTLVGRYANRIGGARFSLDGVVYQLDPNNGSNSIHGGKTGFQSRVWAARQQSDSVLVLSFLSIDGEEGFPGNLKTQVTYTLTADKALRIDYAASTDKPTVLNLTNHSYFNLNGEGSGDVLDHIMQINAEQFTETDAQLIPTGKLLPVSGTPLDFRKPVALGARINDTSDVHVKRGRGYDHNYVLAKSTDALSLAATVVAPKTGIVMKTYTTEPGVQLYTGNFLRNVRGRAGSVYNTRDGFCLETQHYPDSPNKPDFPSTVLRPWQTFRSTTLFGFSVLRSK